MNKLRIGFRVLIGIVCINAPSLRAAEETARPVTPDATPEAVELLNFFYRISGNHTLSGQHNFPGDKEKHTVAASRAWGKTPAVFGKDWGFAKEGDKDSAYVRDQIVDELKAHYRNGSLVVMCWHEVPPTADEPVTFMRQRGSAAATGLKSVQGQLTEAQYKDLLTPGSELNRRWCAQVDAIVPYLKKLEEAHVPLLRRPLPRDERHLVLVGRTQGRIWNRGNVQDDVRPACKAPQDQELDLGLERRPARRHVAEVRGMLARAGICGYPQPG